MVWYLIASFLLASILGVFLHFTHNWFKKGVLLHFFSALNESTWEHMKLSYFPMMLIVTIQYLIFGHAFKGFWFTGFLVAFLATALIPVLYYPIRAILKKEIAAVSISLYFVCISIAFIVEYWLLSTDTFLLPDLVGIAGLVVVTVLFALFSYYPPRIFLLKDPVTGKYGDTRKEVADT